MNEKLLTTYSQGRTALNVQRIFYPYGNGPPKNVLESNGGSPELLTQVGEYFLSQ